MRYLLAILFAAIIAQAASSQTNVNEQVWQKAEALNKAIFETKDSAVIEDLVAKEVTYGHSGGTIEDKVTMLHNAVANKEVYKNITIERQGAINAGNTVVVRYILRADALKDGNTSALNIGIMQVWAKDRGNWRLFARQAVKLNPK
jgi:hypothetical protein